MSGETHKENFDISNQDIQLCIASDIKTRKRYKLADLKSLTFQAIQSFEDVPLFRRKDSQFDEKSEINDIEDQKLTLTLLDMDTATMKDMPRINDVIKEKEFFDQTECPDTPTLGKRESLGFVNMQTITANPINPDLFLVNELVDHSGKPQQYFREAGRIKSQQDIVYSEANEADRRSVSNSDHSLMTKQRDRLVNRHVQSKVMHEDSDLSMSTSSILCRRSARGSPVELRKLDLNRGEIRDKPVLKRNREIVPQRVGGDRRMAMILGTVTVLLVIFELLISQVSSF